MAVINPNHRLCDFVTTSARFPNKVLRKDLNNIIWFHGVHREGWGHSGGALRVRRCCGIRTVEEQQKTIPGLAKGYITNKVIFRREWHSQSTES